MSELCSRKRQRAYLVRSLRNQGQSWVEIAEALRRRYRFNARVALRYAHQWSQRQAADEWNQRWPDELKTFKTFSYWEQWPSTTGHAPTFDNLAKLAELYECAVSDLLADLPNFRHLDTKTSAGPTAGLVSLPAPQLIIPDESAVRATATALALPEHLVPLLLHYLGSLASADRDVLSTPAERDRAYHQLVQILRSWAHTMDRRDMLRLLAWAATTASLATGISSDAHQRIAAVFSTGNRVDTPIIEHIEAVLWHCIRQDDTLGPQAVLNTVLAQRDLASALVGQCPDALRPRMLSALSNASREAGWLSFDLNQFDHASYYYEDARTRAHEANNIELGAFVLCQMSHLATWRGAPHVGIDHAVAAGRRAQHSGDMRLRAYTADVAARAYAADGQRDACLTALDTAHTALTAADDQTPSYLQFYNEAQQVSIRGLCHLELHEGQRAAEHYGQSLKQLDPSYVRNVAFANVHLGMAYIQCEEIEEATRLLGNAAELATQNSSVRLIERLKQGRAELHPWNHTSTVRQLDERLASYAMA